MKKNNLKSVFFLGLIFSSIQIFAQTGAFRVRNLSTGAPAIQLGYDDYRYLSFGKSSSNPNNGAWAIEHWEGGLNFWKPFPTSNYGNYRLFLPDESSKMGVNMRPDNVNSTNYRITDVLQVRGYTKAHGYWTWSDSSLKRNVSKLDEGLTKILALKPVKYFYKENNAISGVPNSNEVEIKTNLFQNIDNPTVNSIESLRYGLIAQEAQSVIPNLVQDNGNQKAVNYLEIVPLLIKSTQEQQAIIEALKQEIEDLKGKTVYTDVDKTKLFQNDPNPFRGTTNFTYFIDENVSVSNAIIEVRNIMGVLQSSITLGDRSGLGKITFDSNGLTDGYYIYTLKINGSVKDSKMMLVGE